MNRPRLNYYFGAASLALGAVLVYLSSRGGSGFDLGLIFGIILLFNGAIRLWVARGK